MSNRAATIENRHVQWVLALLIGLVTIGLYGVGIAVILGRGATVLLCAVGSLLGIGAAGALVVADRTVPQHPSAAANVVDGLVLVGVAGGVLVVLHLLDIVAVGRAAAIIAAGYPGFGLAVGLYTATKLTTVGPRGVFPGLRRFLNG